MLTFKGIRKKNENSKNMLSWMCDHTRNKTTRDNCIQGDIDVTSIEENITKDRLK